jgi:hypothetical protein
LGRAYPKCTPVAASSGESVEMPVVRSVCTDAGPIELSVCHGFAIVCWHDAVARLLSISERGDGDVAEGGDPRSKPHGF